MTNTRWSHQRRPRSPVKQIRTRPQSCGNYRRWGRYGILKGVQPERWGVESLLAEVKIQEGEPLENALRRFKRKVQQEDIIKEVKRHSYYMKPGEKMRMKQALARKRNRKKARKEQTD